MKQVQISDKAGRQIVVFDQLDVTYPGGVYIDPTTAKARFTDGVIPAGTLVMPDTNGTFKVVNETLSQTNTAGAVGLTIADLTSGYATSAPKTFILKLLIGLIVGLVAHKGFKINEIVEKKKLVLATVCSASCGLLFNIIADPLVGYFYKQYVLGLPQEISEAFAKISALTTSVNAVASVVFATVLYLALRPVLKKEGFLH